MITTYQWDSYVLCQGKDWMLMAREANFNHVSNVFHYMERKIRENREIEFDNLLPILKEAYRWKNCRSHLYINEIEKQIIEFIPPRKTMPLIWIVKNPTPL